MWVCAHYICIYTGSCCALTSTCSPQVCSRFSTSCKWQKINGNFRILKWRYCTIQFADFITMAGFVKKVSMDPRNGGPLRIDSWTKIRYRSTPKSVCQWIGLRENLQESPIFNWKIDGFRLRFSPTNQSIDGGRCWKSSNIVVPNSWLLTSLPEPPCMLDGGPLPPQSPWIGIAGSHQTMAVDGCRSQQKG